MTPLNPNFVSALEALVMSMLVAQTLKLKFNQIAAGQVELSIPYQDEFSFRPGQLQATFFLLRQILLPYLLLPHYYQKVG